MPCASGYSCAQRGAPATGSAKSFRHQRPRNRPGTRPSSLCRLPFFDAALRCTETRNLPVPVRCQTSTLRTNTWWLQLSHDGVPMLRLNKRSHRLSTSCDSPLRDFGHSGLDTGLARLLPSWAFHGRFILQALAPLHESIFLGFGIKPAHQSARNLFSATRGSRVLMQQTCQNGVLAHWSRSSFVLSCLFLSATCSVARAQAVVEAAGATSVSATAAAGASQLGFSAPALPENKNKSPHMAVRSGPPPEVANRKALEERAGKDAGKVLLRSVPTGAQVWIDGAFVGSSPMLLILAPGKYQVELRGQRLERATRSVDLLPHETREVTLTLAVRYPTRATMR